MTTQYAYETPDGKQETLTLLGHRLLVRKCLAATDGILLEGDVDEGKAARQLPEHLRAEAQAVIDSLQERTNMAEVLAVGPLIGKPRDLGDVRRYNRGEEGKKRPVNRWVDNPVKVGDFVALPEQSEMGWMFAGVTGYPFDYIVDEHDVVFIARE